MLSYHHVPRRGTITFVRHQGLYQTSIVPRRCHVVNTAWILASTPILKLICSHLKEEAPPLSVTCALSACIILSYNFCFVIVRPIPYSSVTISDRSSS